MSVAAIPMRLVGPIKIIGPEIDVETKVPLATLETPLWPSVNRGAKLSLLCGGIKAVIVKDIMTRSVLLAAPSAIDAVSIAHELPKRMAELKKITATTSRFVQLEDFAVQIVGNLLYIRFACTTGDAAGHNMVTKAADALLAWLLKEYAQLNYISVSGNYCVDKKVSAVNGILGRGKYVIAEMLLPRKICQEYLHTTPEKIVELNVKKNLLGSIINGGVRSANAHFANMLLAVYLATGQDAANIVEGSQGITHAEISGDDLYFSVTLPNIIVGTIGAGKDLAFVKENLQMLGCLEQPASQGNARRLALIIAATVFCGELSLMAAQAVPGELMRSHLALERRG